MLRFYELAPSPNNVKVRLALAYKGIPFEAVPVDPADRSAVLEVSGQVNTPVIVDDAVVINDSEAILQYLDANYPDTPRLFPREKKGRRAADVWRTRIENTIGPPWLDIFLASINRTDGYDEASPGAYADALREFDAELDGRASFHDDPEMAVCDLRVAEFAVYGLPGEELIERCRLFGKFAEQYGIERGAYPSLEAMLDPWNQRLA